MDIKVIKVEYKPDGDSWLEITTRRVPASEVPSCEECGTPIFGFRSDKKFCSDRCRIRAHRKRQLEGRLRAGPRWQENGYVFPTLVGTGMSGTNLRNRSLRPLLERAGLPRLTFHELRHTFATLELEIGTPAKVVQEILGHASIVQTLNTYSHVVPSMQDAAVERLRGHLFGGENERKRNGKEESL